MSKCKNPECHNHNDENGMFCEECLELVVGSMTTEDLYDMFAEGDFNFERAIQDGEAHGLLTPQARKSILKYKAKWFKIINDIMLKKMSTGQ